MKIEAVEIQFSEAEIDEMLASWRRMLEGGRLSQGPEVAGFEAAFGTFTGAGHCVAVSSGSAALELLLQATGPHLSVLVPGNTNFATYMAAVRTGSDVVLMDVDPASLSPSLDHVELAYAGAAPKPSALILVHMGGVISGEAQAIVQWCRERDIVVIEDCAHAHGSLRDGVHAGRFGSGGAFSFFATKVLPIGEGGMIVTDSEELASECRLLRNMGKREAFVSVHERLASNARMLEMAAAVGRVTTAGLCGSVNERRRVQKRYERQLTGRLSLVVPQHPYSGYKAVAYLPENSDRGVVKREMATRGISLQSEIYELPLHLQPALREYHRGVRLPGAEWSCHRQICLPIYPGLTDDAVDHVAQNLLEVVGNG